MRYIHPADSGTVIFVAVSGVFIRTENTTFLCVAEEIGNRTSHSQFQ